MHVGKANVVVAQANGANPQFNPYILVFLSDFFFIENILNFEVFYKFLKIEESYLYQNKRQMLSVPIKYLSYYEIKQICLRFF